MSDESSWENIGFENEAGQVSLIWKCQVCGYEGQGGLIPPKICPVCDRLSKGLPIYAIAYSEEDGSDFAENEPYIFQVGGREESFSYAESIKKTGYKNVTVFRYEDKQSMLDGHETWNFVKERVIV